MKTSVQKQLFAKVRVNLVAFLAFLSIGPLLNAQCVVRSGQISGFAFEDQNSDGVLSGAEAWVPALLVTLYDPTGALIATTFTDNDGQYQFNNLTDGTRYKVVFGLRTNMYPSNSGPDNKTDVQMIQSPACGASFGLYNAAKLCPEVPRIFTTCFVQGPVTQNTMVETLIGLDYNFNNDSPVKKFASHGETGSVWGIAWKNSTQELFSAAFVKQRSGLTPHGHDAILKTSLNNGMPKPTTALFTKLSSLGITTGTLSVTDINDCAYGNQVGKIGLGAMVMTDDEKYLYVTNLYNKSVVRVQTHRPTSQNTREYFVPNPGCSDGDYQVFALELHEGELYVGVTCTAETSRNAADSRAVVMKLNNQSLQFEEIFSTNAIKGFWKDTPFDDINASHWLTDLAFTDEGNMILSLSDRVGHKFCRLVGPQRLDFQNPDILLVWNDNGTWRLENNGIAGPWTGSGVGNGEGPGGGEFFGFDAWPFRPDYHPEVALGSVIVLPGTGTVVATAYDPGQNSYSGGLHRYNTSNGALVGSKELYVRSNAIQFGKASGFGGISLQCGLPPIEVGDVVWFDTNGNGIYESSEDPVPGIRVQLYDHECNLVETVVTNTDGRFVFRNIRHADDYFVSIDPAQYNHQAGVLAWGGEVYTISSILDNGGNAEIHCNNILLPFNTLHTDFGLDIGLKYSGDFDLQIRKNIIGSPLLRLDEFITFGVTVTNVGSRPAGSILIHDMIPAGYEFIPEMNPSWTLVGNVPTHTHQPELHSGESFQVFITLRAKRVNSFSQYRNEVRIIQAVDPAGEVMSDPNDFDRAMPFVFDLELRTQILREPCLSVLDTVAVVHTISNAGNVDAKTFEITNHMGNGLKFIPQLNPGWVENGSRIQFTGGDLPAGSSRDYVVYFEMLYVEGKSDYSSFAEISRSIPVGSNDSFDFDSTPSVTGEEHAEDDNQIARVGGVHFHDISLRINKSGDYAVKVGNHMEVAITLTNEGTLPISKIILAYQISNGNTDLDHTWNKGENHHVFKYEHNFSTPFMPGQSVVVPAHFNIMAPGFEGFAVHTIEIAESWDICGRNVTSMDVDSAPMNSVDWEFQFSSNDSFARNGIEDDAAFFRLYMVEGGVSLCRCLSNSVSGANGQFADTIKITSIPGQTWYVDQAANIFSSTSAAPPANPTPFSLGLAGDQLEERQIDASTSEYTIVGIYADNTTYTIRVRNTFDDIVTLNGGGCRYENLTISGANSLCLNTTETYTVSGHQGRPVRWRLTGGGTIVGPTDQSTLTIRWNTQGRHTVSASVEDANACFNVRTYQVSIGQGDFGMACKANLTLSLDQNCSITITPQMLIAGPLNPLAPYVVILKDDQNRPIEGNTLGKEFIGKTVMAKLMDGCSGNSCWSSIKVEDKIRPVILCENVDILCYKADEYEGPIYFDNCGDPVTMQLRSTTRQDLSCDPLYTARMFNEYVATDAYGNVSNVCRQQINLLKLPLNEVTFPVNRSMALGSAINCNSDFKVDQQGFPHPDVTGIPTINGVALWPLENNDCKVASGYADFDLGTINCVRKIRRVWSVFDWSCDGVNMVTHEQLIEITDDVAPVITCAANQVLTTSGNRCERNVLLQAPTAVDACNSPVRYDIQYPGGFAENVTSVNVTLPVGIHTITYFAYDQCNNRSSCSQTIEIVDNTAPVVICDRNTVVSLDINGYAFISASVLDDGSFDECGIATLEIRRVDLGLNCNRSRQDFGPTAEFCCADVNEDIMMELRVTDHSGNSNTCMVSVQVQDKFAPTITCPAPVTINCDTPYNLNDLSNFGMATATDACGATVTELAPIVNINSCQVGTITRRFMASDRNGSAVCAQVITIVNPDVFTEDRITWPRDYAVTNVCSPTDLEPQNLPPGFDFPVLDRFPCDQVAFTRLPDEYFSFDDGNGSCFKIVRKWIVEDWCRRNEPGYRPFTYDQVIKVSNTIAPEIALNVIDPVACNTPANCDEGMIMLSATGSDDCTPANSLTWSYRIDIDSDGTYINGLNGQGAIASATGIYPVGNHLVEWTFRDLCGNVTTRLQSFRIINCVKPDAICIGEAVVAIEPMDVNDDGIFDIEQGCIVAASVDASSFHPCGFDYVWTFDPDDLTDTVLCFDCFDVGVNTVTVYAVDIFGNIDQCEVEISVQDNNNENVCPDLEECILWPADITIEDCGIDFDPITIGSEAVVDPTCVCDEFEITFTDVSVSYPNATCTFIQRTWRVDFTCGFGVNTFTHVQSISKFNVIAPTIICVPNITVNTNPAALSCSAFANVPVPTVTNASCNTGVVITHNSPFATNAQGSNASGFYPVGTTPITFTVTDACGNTNTCVTNVIVNDNTPPVCAPENITITLDDQNPVVIGWEDVAGGSFDACGGAITGTVSQTSFGCTNLGSNTVTIVLTDASGNSTTCTSTVFVEDEVAPICQTRNITVTLTSNAPVFITPDQIDNGSFDPCGVIISRTVTPSGFDCEMIGQNIVTLTLTDNSGNITSCTAVVTVTDVVAPICDLRDVTVSVDPTGVTIIDVTDINDGSFDPCGDMIDFSITPSSFDCSDIGTNVVNVLITDNSGNTTTCQTTVTVIDDVAPVCIPQDITVTLTSTNAVTVTGSQLDNGSFDECGEITNISVVPATFDCTDLGENVVVITVTDNSGNTSTCTATVTVRDVVAPICNLKDITVSIGNGDQIILNGEDFDDGSFDPCGEIVSYSVVPSVLDCDNLGDTDVVITVTDNSGNTTTCTAIVTLEDITAPVCLPIDVTVFLDEFGQVTLDPNDYTQFIILGCQEDVLNIDLSITEFFCNDVGVNTIDVTITNSAGVVTVCPANITVLDVTPPVINCPADQTILCTEFTGDLSVFGLASATDICDELVQVVVNDIIVLNQCNVGLITRTFTAFDDNNNTSQCVQIIEVIPTANVFGIDNIQFPPAQILVEACEGTDPEDLPNGSTTLIGDFDCALVTINFEDLNSIENTCLDTIFRVWTVVDSCQLDGTGAGIWTFEQQIIVEDTQAPVITGPNGPFVFTLPTGECTGFIDLAGFSATSSCNGLTVSNDSPFADNPNSLDPSGTYDPGLYEINLVATDACGNSAVEIIEVEVISNDTLAYMCDKREREIPENLIFNLNPDIFPEIINQQCGVELIVSFSNTDPFDTTRILTCDDIAEIPYFVYFYEDGVLVDSCKTALFFIDPNDFCNTSGGRLAAVLGEVIGTNGIPVPDAKVVLDGANTTPVMTTREGRFRFPDMDKGGSYMVMPEKDDDHTAGVTTLDLILIQQHILGMQPLDGPYNRIAADINNDKRISTADLVDLRKLILGIHHRFPQNKSWKLIDRAHEFIDPNQPFALEIPEYHNIPVLYKNERADFVGVKIGDVNGSFRPDNQRQPNELSSRNQTLKLQAQDAYVEAGDLIEVSFVADRDQYMDGYQLFFANSNVDVVRVESEVFGSNQFFGQNDQRLSILAYEGSSKRILQGQPVFTIVGFATKSGLLSDVLGTPHIERSLVNEYYADGKADRLELRYIKHVDEPMTMGQNIPNPWKNNTQIEFFSPKDQNLSFDLYDASGRRVVNRTIQATKGKNQIYLDRNDVPSGGVYFYEIGSPNVVLRKKMIVMD